MLKRLSILLLPALLATPISAVTATAGQNKNTQCLARSKMVEALVDEYGEQLAEVHEIRGKGLLEFHVSPDDGTWTALITKKGTSCVVATGEGLDHDAYEDILEPGLEI